MWLRHRRARTSPTRFVFYDYFDCCNESKTEHLLFSILFPVEGGSLSEEELAVRSAIDIHDSVLAATLGTEPVSKLYAQTFAFLTDTYLTTYHLFINEMLIVSSIVREILYTLFSKAEILKFELA